MARLRKFSAYRSLERPYTRVSAKRKHSFIRKTLNTKIIRFVMGNQKKNFAHTILLKSKSDLNIRDNALESARITANRVLEGTLGNGAFFMKVRAYPHHVLRENPVASGAGADRFSTGMQKAFGKPIGQAARFKKGAVIFEVRVDKSNLDVARKAMKVAGTKIPCSTTMEIIDNK